ncbi:MAG: tRNA adenosine(34) deaminase TadA [Deltaproteobacteria bacterium]|nr:tRNA adenosine(34) deaminase TadA [Deltaproteobacteria bacterium]
MVNEEDHYYIGLALEEAKKACLEGEVPVGAVVVHDGQVIAEGYNRRESDKDPTSHAEMLAIRLASQALNRWRLSGSTLYVTLEPCIMCMGAAILARIDRLVFGCFDPKGGAAGSLFDISADSRLNHSIKVLSGVRESECAGILKDFFRDLRKK